MNEKFSCRLCGECCSGDMKVFLNPADLDKLVKFHGLENRKQLWKNNSRLAIAEDNYGAPRVQIKFRKRPFPFCPYLENRWEEKTLKGYCTLHPDYKPLICRLAPVSRCFDSEKEKSVYFYIPPHRDCPGCVENISELAVDKNELSEELVKDLKEEEIFFRQLEKMLDDNVPFDEMIHRLYY